MKTGQISINITWIFAAIAGITVFLFITGFAQDLTQQQDTETQATVLQYFNNQLQTVANTGNKFERIETSQASIKYRCERPATSELTLQGAPSTTSKRYQPIYTPNALEDTTFYTWTLDWTLANRIDRFLYITDPDTVFIIVKDNEGLWQKYIDEIPSGFTRAAISQDDVESFSRQGPDKYRYIFFNQSATDLNYLQGDLAVSGDISAVNIKPRPNMYGRVGFYQMTETALEQTDMLGYVGQAMMYGAVFSENVEQYRCNRAKAYTRLRQRADLEIQRLKAIRNDLEAKHTSPECKNPPVDDYPTQCSECLNMLVELEQVYRNINNSARPGREEDIAAEVQKVKSLQQSLKKGRNCPTL